MLVIKNLEKSYGNFKAVKGLNLEIKKGEIFGFIGPNGAGKKYNNENYFWTVITR